jgi:hypothetical protein
MSATPDPDCAAANPQRSAQTATVMLILDILDIVVGGRWKLWRWWWTSSDLRGSREFVECVGAGVRFES